MNLIKVQIRFQLNFFFIVLFKACKHVSFKTANEYPWSNECIILGAQNASDGIYNFLQILRAHHLKLNQIRPIVLLLEDKPGQTFLEAISWFPLVYWMRGSINK